MKTLKRLSAFLLTLMLSVGVVSMPVMAAGETVKQDGLEITLTTDKEEYNDGEEIKLTLKVKNTNSEAVTDLRLASIISDGYQLTEESIQKLKAFVALGGGAEESVDITVVKKDAGTSGGSGGSGESTPAANVLTSILKSPNTGDSHNIALWVAVFCAGAALIGVAYAIKRKKAKQALSVILCVAMAASTFVTSSETVSAAVQDKTVVLEKTVKYAGKDVTFKANFSYKYEDGYKLVWADEFNGTELNRDDWNVELHDPGWVNSELQAYVDSKDNITVKDGKLIITPIQTRDENGNYSYTSGRISTQKKHTFKYGKFEARVKVPNGMGYLPAFWLMADDENLYGQWPRCGEIDIMEVHGSAPQTAYGTIHYGDPHSESQGTYSLSEGSFADDFHTFTCEWEPGKISWYVDGILFHTENDWFSAAEGQGELTYPAPFDQPFYIILNLAVGGSWVDDPDNATFKSQPYEVDYVRVYQKDSYDENVTKPVKDVVLRDPDATGNYIINGDFSVAEDLTDDAAWKFLTALGGEATAAIKNNEMVINSTNAGTVDYSVQLVQANLPMREGASYTLTFDAYADEARTMIVDVSAPDRSFARYLPDTTLNLTTEKQSYSYPFKMTQSDDANGRLEFNLGNQGSVAGVHISNVKLVQTNYEAPSGEEVKKMLADGNHVYNGQFQEGSGHMGYWTVTNNVGAQVSVTDLEDGRRLKVVIPESAGAEATVTVAQKDLALTAGAEYAISYEAEGNVAVTVEGVSYANGTAFTANENAGDNHIVLTFKGPGTHYIDNVRIDEDKLIKNGSFSAGFSGYQPFVDSGITSQVTYVVDSLTESNAADFTINNTGTQDWQIQLKQNNVRLEKGQWYNLSLKMKSSIARDVSVAIQRDGSKHTDAAGKEDWTPYLQKTVALGSDYQTYQFDFQMTEDTDLASIFNVTMGAVGGKQITQQHRICIDDIVLEKIDAPKQEETVSGTELIKNGDFSRVNQDGTASDWTMYVQNGAPGVGATATYGVEDGKAVYNITDVGTADWHVQLKQSNLTLETGATYQVSFKILSSVDRTVKYALQDPNNYSLWYTVESGNITLKAGEEQLIKYTMTLGEGLPTSNNIDFQISMGKAGDNPQPGKITIDDVSILKLSGGSGSGTGSGEGEAGGNEGGNSTTPAGTELIKNGNFVSGKDPWTDNCGAGWVEATATSSYSNNEAEFNITNVGNANWHVQLEQGGLTLVKGKQYILQFVVEVNDTRDIEYAFLDNVNSIAPVSYAGEVVRVEAGGAKTITRTITMNQETDSAARFQISMGKVGELHPAGKVTIKSVSLKMVEGSENSGTTEEGNTTPAVLTFDNFRVVKSVSAGDANANMFERGAFTDDDVAYVTEGNNIWDYWAAYPAGDGILDGDPTYTDGVMKVSIKDVGTVAHGIQLAYKNEITFEPGVEYQLTFDVTSTTSRKIVSQFQDKDFAPIGYTATSLTAGTPQKVTVKFTPDATQASKSYKFCINLGKVD